VFVGVVFVDVSRFGGDDDDDDDDDAVADVALDSGATFCRSNIHSPKCLQMCGSTAFLMQLLKLLYTHVEVQYTALLLLGFAIQHMVTRFN